MLNSVGLPGPGIDAWIADDLPALEAHGARVIASIWGRTVEEYARGRAARARRKLGRATGRDRGRGEPVCPNVEDRAADVRPRRRRDHAPRSLAVVDALGGALPVFAKLSPNVTDIARDRGRRARRGRRRAHVGQHGDGSGRSTRRTRRPKLGAGGGGSSGPPIRPVALRAVWEVSTRVSRHRDHRHRRRQRPARTRSRCCSRARPRSASAPRRSPIRARRCGSCDEIEQWCAAHGVARVARSDRKLEEV